ncbi:MAG TPA: hypothetical protein VF060_11365 [Trebonia sp.]
MGGGDSADDGQAEAVAPVAAGRARTESLEGLEEAVDFGRRDDRPRVGYRQDGLTIPGAGGDLDITAGGIMPGGVVDQVGDKLLKQERVTVENGGPGVDIDAQVPAADRGASGAQIRAGDSRQVQGLALARASFAAGQCEQRLDEAFLLGVGGEQFPADVSPRAHGGRGVGESDLEQGPFAGQRGAQFMRSADGEAPLSVERRFQPREQAVEGIGEFPELVVGSVQGQPLRSAGR